MSEKRLYLYTIFALISKGLINLCVFLASILLIRILTKEDYGKYSYVASIAGIFGVIINFGLNNYFIREMAREGENAKSHLATFLGVQMFLAGIAALILFGTAFTHSDPDYVHGISYFAIAIAITSLCGPYMSLLAARRRNDLIYWQMIFQAFLQLVLTAVGLFVHLPLGYFMLIPLMTGTARIIHSFIDVYRFGWSAMPKFHIKAWKRVFIDGLPFGLLTGINIVYVKLDIILFAHFQTTEWTAVYAASSRLAYTLGLIPSAVTENLYPIFSRKKGDESAWYQSLLERFTLYNWALYVPIAVGGLLEATGLINFLLGERYTAALKPFSVYLFMPLFMALYLGVNHYLVANGKTWSMVKAAAFCLIVNLLANIVVLMNFRGMSAMVGSALVTLGTEALLCGLSFWFLFQLGKFHFPVARFMRVFLPTGIMGVILWLLPPWNVFVRIALGSIIYAFGVWHLGILTSEDKDRAMRFLRSKLRSDPGLVP